MILFPQILLMLVFSAWAIKGEYAPKKFQLPSTCLLKFSIIEKGQTLSGSCSASFLGNKTFITAEHCHKSLETSFSQGTEINGPELPVVICAPDAPVKLSYTHSVNGLGLDHSQDIALFKVEKNPTIDPIKLAKDSPEIDQLMTNNDCYINGYGLDNDNKHGVLRAAKVKAFQPKVFSLFGTNNPSMFQIGGGNSADHGDSGGPSFCLDKKGKPVLTGIIHGTDKGSSFTKIERISQVKTLIDFYLNSPTPDLELLKQANKTSNLCTNVMTCLDIMKKSGQLTQDVGNVIAALVQQNEINYSKMVKGQNVELNSFTQTWEEMKNFYVDQGCYEIVYE
jgi:hypothetical protein